MSWGAYLMYYKCPNCGRKFRWDLGEVSEPEFGLCPGCATAGVLEGESKALPADPDSYPECSTTDIIDLKRKKDMR